VLYLCTGEFINHPGAEAFRILFVDADNSWLSQMAEGIGNTMGVPRFVFSSAGIAPEPLEPRLMEFLAKKGVDIARHSSKTREQVPNWEHYQVVIALCDEARKAFPPTPTKTICLAWNLPLPGELNGSAEAVQTAFESAYRSLESQVRDLVEAIRGEPQQRNNS
jgi:protein-tyrosine-phosphatase